MDVFAPARHLVTRALLARGYQIARVSAMPVTRDGASQAAACDEHAAFLVSAGADKAHYGSGTRLLGDGWVNLDLCTPRSTRPFVCLPVDLAEEHPFPDGFFRFAYAEDFIEHLTQEQALRFLSEVARTLAPGGVLRLSTPGLRGVMAAHYGASTYAEVICGGHEAYAMWGHHHFFCEESLSVIASGVGFGSIVFESIGASAHIELRGLESRADQQDLNVYAELTK